MTAVGAMGAAAGTGVTLAGAAQANPLIFIKAVNVGRRPLRIVSAGLFAAKTPRERSAAFGGLRTLPKTLNEGEEVNLPVLVNSVAAGTVLAGKRVPTIVYVTDAAGRVHRGRVSLADQRKISEAARPADRAGGLG